MLSGLRLRAFPTCSWLFTWIFYGLVPGACSLNPSSMLSQTSNSSQGRGPCCYCNPNGCTSLSGSVLRRGPGSTKAGSSDVGGGWWNVRVFVYVWVRERSCLQNCKRFRLCNFGSIRQHYTSMISYFQPLVIKILFEKTSTLITIPGPHNLSLELGRWARLPLYPAEHISKSLT